MIGLPGHQVAEQRGGLCRLAGLTDRDLLAAAKAKKSGSQWTLCWRKMDSNSWSRFEKSRPYKTVRRIQKDFQIFRTQHDGKRVLRP